MSGGEDWCTILRVPTHWRVLFPTPQDASTEELGRPEAIEARMQALAAKEGVYDIAHVSFYRIHQRVAKKYRAGNVLLAGDAAHANNPLGGMGMNGGLHDAVNLCDKLIAIMRQGASEDLLDLYERQRRTVTVDFIQAQTIQNKKNVEESDAAARLQRIAELRRIVDDKALAVAFLRRNNMIDAVERSYAIT
jgi:3-(3-hydroxy-phenyl)propionate hydroxylase